MIIRLASRTAGKAARSGQRGSDSSALGGGIARSAPAPRGR